MRCSLNWISNMSAPMEQIVGVKDLRELKRQEELTPIVKVQSLNYKECFERFLFPNRPFILQENFTKEWRSRREWQKDGKINFDVLKSLFGDSVVPVAQCNKEEFCSHPKIDMKFADFISYWTEHISKNYPAANDVLYLKDWHFNKAFPEYKAYETPVFFSSDWLNEFWDRREDGECDDYRFVYMGPKGSWTPFHADVFHSYSWSANICGKKKWILFPPGEEECLRDKFGHLVFDVTSKELDDADMYPHYNKLQHRYEVIQETGEIIFVPSGWHHQVHNLEPEVSIKTEALLVKLVKEDTISINHNWMNGCNARISWDFLQASLRDVQREIQDCKEMEGWLHQCQVILKASAGIDFPEFLTFMEVIAENRLELLEQHGGDEIQIGTCSTERNSNDIEERKNNLLVCQIKENIPQSKETEATYTCKSVGGDFCVKSSVSKCVITESDNSRDISDSACYDIEKTEMSYASPSVSVNFNTLNLDELCNLWKKISNISAQDMCSNSEMDTTSRLPENFNPNHPLHWLFDISVVRKIIMDMMKSEVFNNFDCKSELERARRLLLKLEKY